ncbi:hypothetical protein D9M71_763080 [compost metagenome]
MQAAQPAHQDQRYARRQAGAAQGPSEHVGHQQRDHCGAQVTAEYRPGLRERAGRYRKQQHRRGTQWPDQVLRHWHAEYLGAQPDAEHRPQRHADGSTTPF